MKLSDIKIGDVYFYSQHYSRGEIFFVTNVEKINKKIEFTTMWIEFNYSKIRFVKEEDGSIYCHGTPAHMDSSISKKISKRQALVIIFTSR